MKLERKKTEKKKKAAGGGGMLRVRKYKNICHNGQ